MFNPVTREWEKQKVYFGQLANGQRGLFTNGFLVLSLDPKHDPKAIAEKHGFEFVVK